MSAMRMEPLALEVEDSGRRQAPGVFSIAALGDLMYTRRFAARMARVSRIPEFLGTADLTVGNLETSVLDLGRFPGWPAPVSGGSWMYSDPEIIADLRELGVRAVSLANNHATDWGWDGLLETLDRTRAGGIAAAGAGRSLSEARSACYVDVDGVRVALVAVTTTATELSPAADALGMMRARPGISVVRLQALHRLSPEDFGALGRIVDAESTYTARRRGARIRVGDVEFVEEGGLALGAVVVDFEPDPEDVAQVLLGVRQARENADYVVFSLHSHEPDNGSVPAGVAVDLARAAVDAGSDLVFGHGPHRIRGIEIHAGRPILHSLGNFAMMSGELGQLPRDTYRLLGREPGVDAPSAIMRSRNRAIFRDGEIDAGLAVRADFSGGDFLGLEILPIDLADSPDLGLHRGVPHAASESQGRATLTRLAELSAPFGARLRLDGERATVAGTSVRRRRAGAPTPPGSSRSTAAGTPPPRRAAP